MALAEEERLTGLMAEASEGDGVIDHLLPSMAEFENKDSPLRISDFVRMHMNEPAPDPYADKMRLMAHILVLRYHLYMDHVEENLKAAKLPGWQAQDLEREEAQKELEHLKMRCREYGIPSSMIQEEHRDVNWLRARHDLQHLLDRAEERWLNEYTENDGC